MTEPINSLPDGFESDESLEFTEWEDADDKFALRVLGNTMIDDHICDGDYVIIQRQAKAKDGQTVAVRTEDGEGKLRVFRHDKDGRIRLEARNRDAAAVDEVYHQTDEVKIIGVLVGVVRKY